MMRFVWFLYGFLACELLTILLRMTPDQVISNLKAWWIWL